MRLALRYRDGKLVLTGNGEPVEGVERVRFIGGREDPAKLLITLSVDFSIEALSDEATERINRQCL